MLSAPLFSRVTTRPQWFLMTTFTVTDEAVGLREATSTHVSPLHFLLPGLVSWDTRLRTRCWAVPHLVTPSARAHVERVGPSPADTGAF